MLDIAGLLFFPHILFFTLKINKTLTL